MQLSDRQRFSALMSGIADYYRAELSNVALRLYWQGLQQFDIDDVERALWEHMQNPDAGQYLPKIADVTRILLGRTQDQAAAAWNKVDAAVRTVGTYADVVFDDALIHRVISELGGWIWLGKQPDAEWPFVARRFEALYRGYRLRAESPPHTPQLTGLANAHNALEGREAMPPLLIGDLAAALRVRQGGSDAPLLALHQVAKKISMQYMALSNKKTNPKPEGEPHTKETV